MILAVDRLGRAAGDSEEKLVVPELLGQASPASSGFGPNDGSAHEAILDLQLQVNELCSDLTDERERRIDRRQETSRAALVVLAALVGIGGLWACAKFRVIAREARIGAAAARALATVPRGQAPSLPHAALSGDPGLAFQLGREGALLPPGDLAGNGQGPTRGRETVTVGGRGPATEALHVSPSPLRMGPDRNSSHEEAVADCTEAIRRAPDDPLLYLKRGKALAELGRHEDAIADYDRSIGLDPGNVAAYLSSCQARSDLERNEEALEDCERTVSLDPNLAGATGDQ